MRRFPCPPDLAGRKAAIRTTRRSGSVSAVPTTCRTRVRADDTLGPVIQTLDALPDQLAGVQLEGGINVWTP